MSKGEDGIVVGAVLVFICWALMYVAFLAGLIWLVVEVAQWIARQ